MKKVLFVSDFLLGTINPISDIVSQLIRLNFFKDSEKAIIEPRTNIFDKFEVHTCCKNSVYYYELTTPKINKDYVIQKKSLSLKMKYLLFKLFNKLKIKKTNTYFLDYIKRAKNVFDFDFVCFCVNTPRIEITRWLKKRNIPYIFFLHSTWIDDPRYNRQDIFSVEKEIINNSYKYFIPSFFYDDYKNVYKCDKIESYDLPLLIDKQDVISAFNKCSGFVYKFAYFGALQSFRNSIHIFDFFKENGLKIDVFCYDDFDVQESAIKHKAVSGREFLDAIAKSAFLVVFDNSPPFHNYLPSKVYPYVSFTKPIIIIGNNDKSATITFFDDYPYVYYQKISESSSGLLEFIKKYENYGLKFDEMIYKKYERYSSKKSLSKIDKMLV